MFVYLLIHSSKPIFKIGKARDIHRRMVDIGGSDRFNLRKSRCLRFSSEDTAKSHERTLHRLFKKYRITEEIDNQSGDTEFFNIECFDRVVSFIKNNHDLFECTLERIPKKEISISVPQTPVIKTSSFEITNFDNYNSAVLEKCSKFANFLKRNCQVKKTNGKLIVDCLTDDSFLKLQKHFEEFIGLGFHLQKEHVVFPTMIFSYWIVDKKQKQMTLTLGKSEAPPDNKYLVKLSKLF